MIRKITEFISGEKCTARDIRKACEVLSDGDTLDLQGLRMDIASEGAFVKKYFLTHSSSGEKAIVFPIIGKHNIVIDGNGAELIFHGNILPFVLDNSKNICIKNLSIDYADPFYAQAEIEEADHNRVVLKFDDTAASCRVKEDGQLCFSARHDGWTFETRKPLCLEYERDTGAPSAYLPAYFCCLNAVRDPFYDFLEYMNRYLTAKNLGQGRIELTGEFGFVHTVGNKWVCPCGHRDYPGMIITESEDVHICGVTFYHTKSMSILAQISENITLDHVVTDVRKGSGRYLSVNADTTHFVNCRGKITIRNCKFVKMMDDACNIHGMYLKNLKQVDDVSFTAKCAVNLFQAGDKVSIIDINTAKEVAQITVADSRKLEQDNLILLTAADALPTLLDNYIIENLSTAPEVYIGNTECGSNRPRGFLLSSAGRMTVERCKFYNMNTSINIGGEMLDWYECGAVKDIVIRDNDFDNAAYAGGYPINIIPKINNRETSGSFHGKVVIEGNRFRLHEKRFLCASNVADLIFKNNTYIQDLTLPTHPVEEENGILVEYCEKAEIEEPKTV